MTHRTFYLTNEDDRALLAAYHATHDGMYRTRLQAVRLYGLGYPTEQITIITDCPRSSLLLWCRRYTDGGIAALADHRMGGNSAKLTPDQRTDVSAKLRQYTPRSLFGSETTTPDGQTWCVPDVRRAVQHWYGVTYQSVVSYYNLLHQCGYSYHQPAKVFKSRREADVMEFETQIEKN